MPNIFDNLKTESSIGPALRGALTNFDSCDVATGYLDLRGWASFADIVEVKSPKIGSLRNHIVAKQALHRRVS